MKLKKDRGALRFASTWKIQTICACRRTLEWARPNRGKAQYLADAILCYEKADAKSFQQTDRALIEQIVQEYLEKADHGTHSEFAERRAIYIFAANRFDSQCFGRF